MREDRGPVDDLPWTIPHAGVLTGSSWGGWCDIDFFALVKESVCCGLNEGMSIFLVRGDIWSNLASCQQGGGRLQTGTASHYLIAPDCILQPSEAVWIQVVGHDEAAVLSRRDSEWAHSGHDIADRLTGLEKRDQTRVLRVEPAVPVDFGEVKAESAAVVLHCDVQIVLTSKDFVVKRSEGVAGADCVDFVDDSPDLDVLIHKNLRNDVLVRPKLFTKVELCYLRLESRSMGGKLAVTSMKLHHVNSPTWPASMKLPGMFSPASSGKMEHMIWSCSPQ